MGTRRKLWWARKIRRPRIVAIFLLKRIQAVVFALLGQRSLSPRQNLKRSRHLLRVKKNDNEETAFATLAASTS